MKKRVLSFAMALVVLLGLMPSFTIPAHAAYEDGDECWNCGHYHWDEYMHECGACSPSCTNDWCALETHCHRCGGCLNGDYPCDECGLCKECMDEIGHCSQCDTCWMDYGGDDVLCGNCRRCEFCSPICPECGMCEDCAGDPSDGMHCPECGSCYQVTEQCMFVENNHCKDCCEPCEQCGECIAGDHLETCPDCGLCVECCEFNSMMAGCESGEICVASTDWDDCICEGCGRFFENESDLCGTCHDAGIIRCPDCCELASECSEKMCEYDDEYEEHFCIDCGSCFHDVTLCDTCAGAGELRCEDCCENLTESLGCDGSCGEVWCSNDTYFEQHLDEMHADRPDFDDHDPFPSNRWSHDSKNHWRDCRYCDEDENEELAIQHRTGTAAHSYDGNGVCTVCGYSVGNKLYIAKQPKTVRCKTSVENHTPDPAQGLLDSENNRVTFTVAAKGGRDTLRYQWYSAADHQPVADSENTYRGAATATLEVHVYGEECTYIDSEKRGFYCVVTDGAGTKVTSDTAYIKASHIYSEKYAKNAADTGPKPVYRAVTVEFRDGSEVKTLASKPSQGHRLPCLGDGCDQYKNRSPVMHTFGDATLLGKSSKAGATDYDKVYEKTCTACGYKTYYETHQHVFHDNEDHENEDGFRAHGYLLVKRDISSHTIRCLVEGCSQIKKEDHVWRWQWVAPTVGENGRFFRVCDVCDFNTGRDLAAGEVDPIIPIDEDGNPVEWDMSRALVIAENAKVSRLYAKPNDQLTLIISDNEETLGKRCTGWTVTYRAPDSASAADLTSAYTFTETPDGNWKTTVTFGSYSGGGTLTFTPKMSACTAHTYITTGRVESVCMYDGFAGYRICKYCRTADPTDTRSDEERVLPATGNEHTGTKQPLYEKEATLPSGEKTVTWTTDNTGKRYNYVKGDCANNIKGCDGDFLCSDCQRVIPGKLEYKHPKVEERNHVDANCFRDGYTGDYFCTSCGKRDESYEKGHVLSSAEYRRENHGKSTFFGGTETAATCTTAGKEPDELCYNCNYLVKTGAVIPALGHDWVVDTAHCNETTTAYKCNRKDCTATKFADVSTDSHAVKVDGGTALVGGKAVKKAAEGETVTLKLGTVPEGKRFKEWEVVSGGVVLTNATDSNGAFFTMGALDVEINAVLEDNEQSHTHTGGSSGSGSSSYVITVKDAKNGDVTADRKSASSGTTVTIAVKPASGYVLDDLTVTDAKDKTVKLTDKGSGKYTFTMPSSKVTVEANFSKIKVENHFVDVKPGSYYEDAVIWAVGKGITGGTSATTFDPNAACSRAQAVTFLWRAAGSPAPKSTTMPFTDVPVGSYYYDAVLWAVENGVTNGTSATTFSPSISCNRAQIVTFLWRAQKSPAASAANPFTDVAADAYYTNAVLWAVKEGVTAGTTAATFSPTADCTRAQIVTFIYRALAE